MWRSEWCRRGVPNSVFGLVRDTATSNDCGLAMREFIEQVDASIRAYGRDLRAAVIAPRYPLLRAFREDLEMRVAPISSGFSDRLEFSNGASVHLVHNLDWIRGCEFNRIFIIHLSDFTADDYRLIRGRLRKINDVEPYIVSLLEMPMSEILKPSDSASEHRPEERTVGTSRGGTGALPPQ